MRIGVDFDNTIISYDAVFHKVAVEMGLVPRTTEKSKGQVRDYMRATGNEVEWTRLQGIVYGTRLSEASAFEGVFDFFAFCKKQSIPVYIVSHKTRYPYLGEKFDLHASAQAWLEKMGFFSDSNFFIDRNDSFFELTKMDKLARIGALSCTHFIDDLPEFLAEADFPKNTKRLLFDPSGNHVMKRDFARFENWGKLLAYFKVDAPQGMVP